MERERGEEGEEREGKGGGDGIGSALLEKTKKKKGEEIQRPSERERDK